MSPLVALAVWKGASLAVGRSIILPSPEETAVEVVRIVLSPTFLPVFGATILRVVVSFALSLGASLVAGIAAGLWRPVEDILQAPITVMRSVPTMGVILLSLIWLDSEGAPLFVSALVTVPIMYAAVVGAIRSIDRSLGEMHEVFRVPFSRRLLHFYLPSVAPHLRAGTAAALGLTVKIMIAAEVLSQPRMGVGTMFQIERARLNTPGVFAWCIIVIILAGALDALLAKASGGGSPAARAARRAV